MTVGGGEDVMLEVGPHPQAKSLTMTAKQARDGMGTGLKVTGLPETGNIRVEVTADVERRHRRPSSRKAMPCGHHTTSVDSVMRQDLLPASRMMSLAEMMVDPNDANETRLRIRIQDLRGRSHGAAAKVSKLTESATFPPASNVPHHSYGRMTRLATRWLTSPITARQSAGPSSPSAISVDAPIPTGDVKGMVRLVGRDHQGRGRRRTAATYTLEDSPGLTSLDDGRRQCGRRCHDELLPLPTIARVNPFRR